MRFQNHYTSRKFSFHGKIRYIFQKHKYFPRNFLWEKSQNQNIFYSTQNIFGFFIDVSHFVWYNIYTETRDGGYIMIFSCKFYELYLYFFWCAAELQMPSSICWNAIDNAFAIKADIVSLESAPADQHHTPSKKPYFQPFSVIIIFSIDKIRVMW